MDDPTVESAYAFLRGHTTADIRFDEHFRPLKYVIAPSGRLVAPVMVAMLQTMDTVMFIPDVSDEAMEVQVTLGQFKESERFDPPDHSGGALADRWRIHHGDPPDVQWAFVNIDAVRYDQMVIDGDALLRPNPLVDVEPTLCREVNASRREDLRALCTHLASVTVEDPMLVGVDPLGFDVRGRFDVIRVPATSPMESVDDARAAFDAMSADARERLAGGGAASET